MSYLHRGCFSSSGEADTVQEMGTLHASCVVRGSSAPVHSHSLAVSLQGPCPSSSGGVQCCRAAVVAPLAPANAVAGGHAGIRRLSCAGCGRGAEPRQLWGLLSPCCEAQTRRSQESPTVGRALGQAGSG